MTIFDELMESIKNDNGVDAKKSTVPISEDNVIGNGAHRTAISLYYDFKVPCRVESGRSNYNYQFFRNMYLDDNYCDYIATRYIEKTKKNISLLILWPAAFVDKSKYNRAVEYINKISSEKIVYDKIVDINYQGLRNFMIQAYANHEWIGTSKNHYNGIDGKVLPCYSSEEKLQLFVIEDECENVIALKESIRGMLGVGNDSCHSTDTKEECIDMAHLLLNSNSLHLLNNGIVDYDADLIDKIVSFREQIKRNNSNISDYIIDSSSVMGLYGIRKPRDIDFITIDKSSNIIDEDNHQDYIKYYNTSLDDLIVNPNNYLYAFGMKFITLDVLKRFKLNRKESKDLEDVVLIDRKMKKSNNYKQEIRCIIINIKRSVRNRKTAFRDWLQDRNIYILTKIWHFIVGKGFR